MEFYDEKSGIAEGFLSEEDIKHIKETQARCLKNIKENKAKFIYNKISPFFIKEKWTESNIRRMFEIIGSIATSNTWDDYATWVALEIVYSKCSRDVRYMLNLVGHKEEVKIFYNKIIKNSSNKSQISKYKLEKAVLLKIIYILDIVFKNKPKTAQEMADIVFFSLYHEGCIN